MMVIIMLIFRRLSRDVGPTWTTGSTSAPSTRRERTVSGREVRERTLTSTEVFWTLSLPGMDPGNMDRQGSNQNYNQAFIVHYCQ